MQHVGMGSAHPPFLCASILDAARSGQLLFRNRMKLLILCPIPVEYRACRETLALRDLPTLAGCRTSYATAGEAELFCLETGPGKARSVAGALLGIQRYGPDLVLDSGSCAGIEPGSAIGQIVLARECFEADLAGTPFPRRRAPGDAPACGLEFSAARGRRSLAKRGGGAGASGLPARRQPGLRRVPHPFRRAARRAVPGVSGRPPGTGRPRGCSSPRSGAASRRSASGS